LLLHDAVWVLPATSWTREQFQWLTVEIAELGGDAMLWESHMVLAGQEEALIQRFLVQVDSSYGEILSELEKDPVLHRIARIVDEADVVQEVTLEATAPGLDLICRGIRLISPDDWVALERGRLIYDALYAQLAIE